MSCPIHVIIQYTIIDIEILSIVLSVQFRNNAYQCSSTRNKDSLRLTVCFCYSEVVTTGNFNHSQTTGNVFGIHVCTFFSIPYLPITGFLVHFGIMSGSGSITRFALVTLVTLISFCRIFRFHTIKCPVTVNDGHNCTILTVFTLVTFDSFNGTCRIVTPGYSDTVTVLHYVGNILTSINFCL